MASVSNFNSDSHTPLIKEMYPETESLFKRDCGCSISVVIKMFEKKETKKKSNKQRFSCSLLSLLILFFFSYRRVTHKRHEL